MIGSAERQQIEDAIHREYCRSMTKHGNWDGETAERMARIIQRELNEVDDAILFNLPHFDTHGAFNELAQVAACCQKMMAQIIRREHAKANSTSARV